MAESLEPRDWGTLVPWNLIVRAGVTSLLSGVRNIEHLVHSFNLKLDTW